MRLTFQLAFSTPPSNGSKHPIAMSAPVGSGEGMSVFLRSLLVAPRAQTLMSSWSVQRYWRKHRSDSDARSMLIHETECPCPKQRGLSQIRCVLVRVNVGVQRPSKYRVDRGIRLALHRHSSNSQYSSSTGSELMKTLCSPYSNATG